MNIFHLIKGVWTVVAALGLAVALGAAPAKADCPHKGKTDHPHCTAGGGGDSAPASLEIEYEFGEQPDGLCVEPECASTTITVEGTLKCGNLFCDFFGEVPDEPFGLPEGLRTLLDEVAWRGEPLDPTTCYEYDPNIDSVGTLTATHVFLRSFPDAAEDWAAHVSGTAFDDLDNVRSYRFQLGGGCDSGTCPDLQNLVGAVAFDPGAMTQIDSPTAKGKEERALFGTACRCTMSSTPDCPRDVVDEFGDPIPSPRVRITVTDVTP